MKKLLFALVLLFSGYATTHASDTPGIRVMHRVAGDHFPPVLMAHHRHMPGRHAGMTLHAEKPYGYIPMRDRKPAAKASQEIIQCGNVPEADLEMLQIFNAEQPLLTSPDFSKADMEMQKPDFAEVFVPMPDFAKADSEMGSIAE